MHLLSYKDLVARGIVKNRMTLHRWIESNGFPRPIRLGENTIAFSEAEVESWLADRVARRSKAA